MQTEFLSALNRLPAEERLQLLHGAADELCGRDGPRLCRQIVATQSLHEWQDTFRMSRDALAQAAQGVESTSGSSELMECVAGRRAELKAGVLHATHNISDVRLSDFNWVLKLALSSDRLARLQTPLLSLGLNVEGPGVDGYHEQISLEMGRAELQSLVSTLEQASKVVQQTK
uniref:COMM domain-containing protein n=1 Tax=Eptatretus burgeri TaxID=7764 RepID=A0A8C4X2F6_EPTBU